MQFDIRISIGALFLLVGALLMAYGLWMNPGEVPGSGGLNVDAGWGGVMLLFGIAMLVLARRAMRRKPRRVHPEREQ